MKLNWHPLITGFVQGSILFNIFPDYMDDRTECIITKFVHDIKLGEVI